MNNFKRNIFRTVMEDISPPIFGDCYEMTYYPIEIDNDLMVRYTQPNGSVVNMSVFGDLYVKDNLDGSYTATLCSVTEPIFNKGGEEQIWTNQFTPSGNTCQVDGECVANGIA